MDVLEYFVDRKVSIDMKDRNGFTPLMTAVFNGQEDVVNFLIRNGANTQLRDWNLKTCLHVAVERKQTNILNILVTNGEKYLINSGDEDYKTPLHYAARDGNKEVITCNFY